MDHEEYESQMIDGVNRNAAEYTGTPESTVTVKKRVFTKADARAVRRGLKRMALALITAILFAISVFTFVAVAYVTGYLAVLLFISAITVMGLAFIFLYAQGIVNGGDRNVEK